MTNKRTTKQALVASVLLLCLSFSMLLGTTFAWFTDSATSAGNKIVAGTLDVDLLMWDGDSYEDIGDSNAPIFGKGSIAQNNNAETLWEPGKTQVVYLKIVNAGSLDLKYSVAINVRDNADDKDLYKALEYAITPDVKDGTGVSAWTTGKKVNVGNNLATDSAVKLEAKEDGKVNEHFFALSVHMLEEAGNEYQGGYVEFDIKVAATQVNTEEDSFGQNYDVDATLPDVAVVNVPAGTTEATSVKVANTTVKVPAGAAAGTYKLSLSNEKVTTDGEGNTVAAFDLELTKDGEKAPAGAYVVERFVGKNLNEVAVTHKGEDVSGEVYDPATGIVTFTVDSFSPFAVSYYVGEIKTAEELVTNIAKGGNFILVNDIELDEKLNIPENAKVTLNLNKHNISTSVANAIYNQGDLVITGEGKISSVSNYAIRVQSGSLLIDSDAVEVSSDFGAVSVFNGADVTINGGNYFNRGYNDQTSHTIYLGGYGTININGGTFDSGYSNGGIDTICGYGWENADNEKAVININGGIFYPSELNGSYYFISNYDANWTEINISGGTFHKYDPAKISGTKLVVGYTSVDNGDGTYSVIFPQESFDDLINNAQPGDTVEIPAGEYTFPASDLKEGMILNCAPGTVFEGKSAMNINGATVIGATFSNPDGVAGAGTINGTFKDCVFEGSEALRWCYAGETVVFENCEFKNDFRGVHFDGMDHDVIFKNCKLNGFNAFGGTATVIFEGCTFGYDESRYNGLNMYCNTVLKDCKFEFVSGKTNFIDFEEAGHNLTITNCTATLDGEAANVLDFVGGTYKNQTNITIDGAQYVTTTEKLTDAISSGNVTVTLATGNYTMPSSSTNADITIVGTKDTVLDVTKGAYMDSANVTIEGVTIKTSTGYVMDDAGNKGSDYAALYSPNTTYVNCTFVGPMRIGRDGAKFINCTFTELGNDYIWTYGNDVTFEGCTFNTEGKAILIYSDGGNEIANVTVKNCTFNSTKGAKAGAIANQNCAAIEIHNYGNGVKLVTEGNTNDANFSGEWRIKTYETGRTQIFVNGVEYNTIAIDGKTMTIDANKNVTVQQ